MPETPMSDKVKSFWDKKEGKTGMIFAAGGIFAGLLIMMHYGPALVAAAQNTAILGLYVGAFVAVGALLMNKRFTTLCSFMFQSTMRWITSWFITVDPIGILKEYVEDLKASHAKMDEQIGKLRGVIAGLNRTIKENNESMQNNMNLASQARNRLNNSNSTEDINRMKAQVMLKSRKAGRLKDSNRTFQELRNKIEMIYRVLSKMYTNCGVLIEDTEDSVKMKEIEWKTTRAAHMEVSQNFLDGVDLQNGVFEEKGLEMLEKWEQDADAWLLGGEKEQIISDSSNPNNILNVDIPLVAEQKGANQYGNLFK